MFMVVEMERNLRLHPRDFGPAIERNLIAQLLRDVEGHCSGKYGYVLAVTGVKSVGDGEIRSGTVHVTFPVKFECIICRPFKREIYEAVVKKVIANGFFAESGPLNFFVSVFCLPEGRFDSDRSLDGELQFVDLESSEKIMAGTEVRVAVIGTRFDVTEVSCVGTMRGDYLGVIRRVHESIAF